MKLIHVVWPYRSEENRTARRRCLYQRRKQFSACPKYCFSKEHNLCLLSRPAHLWRWWELETTVIAECQDKCCRCCWCLDGRFLWWMQPECREKSTSKWVTCGGGKLQHNRKLNEMRWWHVWTGQRNLMCLRYTPFLTCWFAHTSCLPLAVWRGNLLGSVWSRRKPRSGKDCHSRAEKQAWVQYNNKLGWGVGVVK